MAIRAENKNIFDQVFSYLFSGNNVAYIAGCFIPTTNYTGRWEELPRPFFKSGWCFIFFPARRIFSPFNCGGSSLMPTLIGTINAGLLSLFGRVKTKSCAAYDTITIFSYLAFSSWKQFRIILCPSKFAGIRTKRSSFKIGGIFNIDALTTMFAFFIGIFIHLLHFIRKIRKSQSNITSTEMAKVGEGKKD
jgi:hypothetical protein